MLQTREQLAAALATRGLLSAHEFQKFADKLTATPSRETAAGIAAVLVEQQKLTQFQADEVLHERPTPLVLDDYVVLDRLGAGNMGEVFRAYHRRLERIVALKMVAAHLTKSDVAVKRFQREVKAAARLSHPNIVTTYDAGEVSGHHYLVMEFVEGSDLSKLKDGERLSVDRAFNLILQAAEGLEYAHANGVIHRDIKPGNLLVDRNDKLRILDLGIARVTQSLADDDGLTRTGYVMGTVDYMAPEQGFDIKHVDERCDIYSLGCTLYRLLTGHVMYAGDTFLERARQHEKDPIPPLRDRCPELPAEVERVYRRLVAKKPKDRYPNMAAVKEALRGLQQRLASGSADLAGGSSWWRVGLLGLWSKPAPRKRPVTTDVLATRTGTAVQADEVDPRSVTSSKSKKHERVGVHTLVPDDEPPAQSSDTRSDDWKTSSATTPVPRTETSARAKLAAHSRRRRMLVATSVVFFGLLALTASFAAGLIGPPALKEWLLGLQRPAIVQREVDTSTLPEHKPEKTPPRASQASYSEPIETRPIVDLSSEQLASATLPNLLPEILSPRLMNLTNAHAHSTDPTTQRALQLPDLAGPQFVSLIQREVYVPPIVMARIRFPEQLPGLSSTWVTFPAKAKTALPPPYVVTKIPLPKPPVPQTVARQTVSPQTVSPQTVTPPNPNARPNNSQPPRGLGRLIPPIIRRGR